jgi:phosphate transport system protein
MTTVRSHFDQQLREVQDDLLILGGMVERALAASVDALKRRDLEASQRIHDEDVLINRKRFETEALIHTILATQQPTAGDLRLVTAALHITVDLERMGDHAAGIAKVSSLIGAGIMPKPLIDIPRMAEHAQRMLRESLDAFMKRDVEAAKRIAAEDDYIDALYDQVYRELLTLMISQPSNITVGTYLLWVCHNLERIADRVTNICERIIFAVTGEMTEINVSKY